MWLVDGMPPVELRTEAGSDVGVGAGSRLGEQAMAQFPGAGLEAELDGQAEGDEAWVHPAERGRGNVCRWPQSAVTLAVNEER